MMGMSVVHMNPMLEQQCQHARALLVEMSRVGEGIPVDREPILFSAAGGASASTQQKLHAGQSLALTRGDENTW